MAATAALSPSSLPQSSAGLFDVNNVLVRSGRYTGDWGAIVKRGVLRVLVMHSKSAFFYDG
jgi:hypothetical protein